MSNTNETTRQDVYSRITNQIIEALEAGVKPWTQPWNAAHAAGHVSRPLRHNGQPYAGTNVLTLWASAMTAHYAAPIWMTFRQAIELGGNVRKGEKGSPVVYANTINRTETDEATGDEAERAIPFLKAYTVFNVEQVEGLPAHFYSSRLWVCWHRQDCCCDPPRRKYAESRSSGASSSDDIFPAARQCA
jgi:antirestriction protein ArdC